MQKFLGLVLLMSGLAMAALWLPSRGGNGQLAQVIEITKGGIARVGRPDAPEAGSANPSEAPGRPTVAAVSSPPAVTSSIRPADAAAPARSSARGPSTGTARPGSQTGIASQVVVTNASVESAPEARLGSPQPATEDAYYALVRDLQKELRRLGCYWGEVDGSWGPGTKRAMGTLMARVNASLPASEPDYILLALARSQPDQTCRRPCPPEQLLVSETGQCLPRALVRHAAGGQAEDASTAPGQDAPSATPFAALPGPMAIGGPRPGIDGGPDAALSVQRPRPPTTLYRYSEPRRDNSWKRKVFGENLYGR